MVYKFKNPPEKEHGEFKCPYCPRIFFNKTSLSGHVGGAHRRFITKETKKPYCKFCEAELVPGKNWASWAITQKNLICNKCKRKQNRNSYYKKKKKRAENVAKHKLRLKKHLERVKREKELAEKIAAAAEETNE